MDLLFHLYNHWSIISQTKIPDPWEGIFFFFVYCVPHARTVPGTQEALSKRWMNGWISGSMPDHQSPATCIWKTNTMSSSAHGSPTTNSTATYWMLVMCQEYANRLHEPSLWTFMMILGGRFCCYLHSTERETDTQRGQVTYPKASSWKSWDSNPGCSLQTLCTESPCYMAC